MAKFKKTLVNGYSSVVCAGGRHHACRPAEWSCGCSCHTSDADAASTASVAVLGEVHAAGVVDGTAVVESTAPQGGSSVDDEAVRPRGLTVDASTGRPTSNRSADALDASADQLRAG